MLCENNKISCQTSYNTSETGLLGTNWVPSVMTCQRSKVLPRERAPEYVASREVTMHNLVLHVVLHVSIVVL